MAITTAWKAVTLTGLVGSSPTSSAKLVFMYYVYFLLLKTDKVYTGCTDNLKRRMSEHESGKVESTKKLLPILIGYESYLLKSDAMRREKFLKSTEGRRL